MSKLPGLYAQDGSYYVTNTDGSGNAIPNAGVTLGPAIRANSVPVVFPTDDPVFVGSPVTWTTATPNFTTVYFNCANTNSVFVTIGVSGVFTAGTVYFLGGNSSSNAVQVLGTSITLAGLEVTNWSFVGGVQNFQFNTTGFQVFGLLLTPVITGSSSPTATITVQPSNAVIQPRIVVEQSAPANLNTQCFQGTNPWVVSTPASATGGYSFSNITTDTTTVVKSGAGTLHTVTFNKPVATEVVTLFDNTAASGTTIGTITVPASPMPVTLTYDIAFATGLTVLTATAISDITVSYK